VVALSRKKGERRKKGEPRETPFGHFVKEWALPLARKREPS
jgi:hypothetical protein